jgi:hypothetical protein
VRRYHSVPATHRFADLGEVRPLRKHVAGVDVRERRVRHLLDVSARGERLLAPRQHDRADRRVGVEAAGGVVDLRDELRVERIERLGPVQRDERNRAAGFSQQRRVRCGSKGGCMAKQLSDTGTSRMVDEGARQECAAPASLSHGVVDVHEREGHWTRPEI